jgi:hypothetical protein
MGTPTYLPIANITMGSAAASVTFSSISQSFRDLILVFDGKSTATADLAFQVNGANTNYNYVHMTGTGSAASSSSRTNGDYIIPSYGVISSVSANQTNCIINFMDYSVTDKHKTMLLRTSDSSQAVSAEAARWASTSAITSIACYALGTTFQSGSTFALYGVLA